MDVVVVFADVVADDLTGNLMGDCESLLEHSVRVFCLNLTVK